jgi:hypothetical protein
MTTINTHRTKDTPELLPVESSQKMESEGFGIWIRRFGTINERVSGTRVATLMSPLGGLGIQADCGLIRAPYFTANSVHTSATLAAMMGNGAGVAGPIYPPQPPIMPHPGHPAAQQQLPMNNWVDNDPNTLLVVATLITTLTYQLGTNVPGGYWQDTQNSSDGKRVLHRAGEPIMRDMHFRRYSS